MYTFRFFLRTSVSVDIQTPSCSTHLNSSITTHGSFALDLSYSRSPCCALA